MVEATAAVDVAFLICVPYNVYMWIEITGVRSRRVRKLVERAAFFFEKELIHPRTAQVLEITFQFKKLKGAYGFCVYEDSHVKPREFTIEIDKGMSDEDIVRTVAHELVHVKQYVKGELKERYVPDKHMMWHDERVDVGLSNLYDVPWEVEARKLEDELFLLYESKVN